MSRMGYVKEGVVVDICWFSVVCWLLWMVCECGGRGLDESSELWLYGAMCDKSKIWPGFPRNTGVWGVEGGLKGTGV